MATVHSEILEDFLTRLSKAEDLEAEQVQDLRTLFLSGDTIKAENSLPSSRPGSRRKARCDSG